MSERISCFIIGDGAMPIRCGEMLRAEGVLIHGVVCADPATQSWAAEHGIPTLAPDGDLFAWMERRPFDYLFNIVNFTIPDQAVLRLPRQAAINFHDGPLPQCGGIHPTSWALAAQAKDYGVVWHRMIDEQDRGQVFLDTAIGKRRKAVDTGRVLVRENFSLAGRETAADLNTQCFEAGLRSFGELLAKIVAHQLPDGEVQDLEQRSYFAKFARPAANALLDVQQAEQSVALVRACQFAPYDNLFAAAKLWTASGPVLVHDADVVDGRFRILAATTPEGQELEVAPLQKQLAALPEDSALRPLLDRLQRRSARAEAAWRQSLSDFLPLSVDNLPGGASAMQEQTLPLPDGLRGEAAAAAVLAALARLSGGRDVGVLWQEPQWGATLHQAAPFFAPAAPLSLHLGENDSFQTWQRQFAAERSAAMRRGPFLRDLLQRIPQLSGHVGPGAGVHAPVLFRFDQEADASLPLGVALELTLDEFGAEVHFRASAKMDLAELLPRMEQLLQAMREQPDAPLARHSLLTEEEHQRLRTWGRGPRQELPPEPTILHTIQQGCARHPQRMALHAGQESLTYQELDVRANRLAHLLRERGVRRGDLVGLCLPREASLLVSLLAVFKCGAAYVPLDPAYPQDRLRFMIEDAQLRLIIGDQAHASLLPRELAPILLLEDEAARLVTCAETAPASGPEERDLAYVIYTSGSTGKPKGVMIEHRQLKNFALAMEPYLKLDGEADAPGRWLAVTSLNFDISVLELVVTLSRGMEVILHREEEREAESVPQEHADKPLDFGLFYFSSDADEQGSGQDRYRLLLEGARFADEHGFSSVWTPERHFHAFGGLYPNPAVTAAALAATTTKVDLRAGSCVLPLHSPLRIAEEWSVVDNLSEGRAGLALASGWQPNDFVLRPEAYAERHRLLKEGIDQLRALWRGEPLSLPDGRGTEVEVSIHPSPVQETLPLWLTAAGNPETFRLAGQKGCHLLTHLLGQDDEELAQKIAIYREAWNAAGHEGQGVVTLMVHTYIGQSVAEAKEVAREPMKAYLRTAVSLVEKAAWEWPAYREKVGGSGAEFRPEELAEEDVEAILDYAFERYFEHSGLFGDRARAMAFADRMKGLGVDELGCLCDFGIPTDLVLEQLPRLHQVMLGVNRSKHQAGNDHAPSIQELLERHQPTHMQCTPSMAQMMVLDADTRGAMAPLQRLLIGGEAFPPALARDLVTLVEGQVLNMYGPTETTIWSTCHVLDEVGEQVPIGKPIANTDVLVLDDSGEPVALGALGELCIGGEGVTRGYLERPEMTAARFVPYRWVQDRQAFLYRTGDLVRWGSHGELEFHGRLDHQVKLRGHRLELGEIEGALTTHPNIREAVAMVREDIPGDPRLVAYLIADGAPPESTELRRYLQDRLPESFLPQLFSFQDRFPTTPNQKIDRQAFPPPQLAAEALVDLQAAESQTQRIVAEIWQELLGISAVGIDQNFFEIGGHSLLSVKVQIEIKQRMGRALGLVDIFRYPTIRGLADLLDGRQDDGKAALASAGKRASARREASARRRPRR
jgi:natural product biosynthesis luciferase-like monooxygenase protein